MKTLNSDLKAVSVVVAVIIAAALLIAVWQDTRPSEPAQPDHICSNHQPAAEAEAVCPGSEWSFSERSWEWLTTEPQHRGAH